MFFLNLFARLLFYQCCFLEVILVARLVMAVHSCLGSQTGELGVILEILIIISLNRVHPEFISLRHVHFERTNAEPVKDAEKELD